LEPGGADRRLRGRGQLRARPRPLSRARACRLTHSRTLPRRGRGGRFRRRPGARRGNRRARRRRQAGLRGRAAAPLPALRAALVTGAARGIGAAIVERLEADGWSVHGVDIEDGDLTTRDGNRTVVEAALERFGRLDAVVANAGFQHVAAVEDFPEETWDRLLALLLTSPFLLAKYAWPALREHGDGRFVAMASAHSLTASPFKAGS